MAIRESSPTGDRNSLVLNHLINHVNGALYVIAFFSQRRAVVQLLPTYYCYLYYFRYVQLQNIQVGSQAAEFDPLQSAAESLPANMDSAIRYLYSEI